MPLNAAFHLGLNCLSKYLFTSILSEKGACSSELSLVTCVISKYYFLMGWLIYLLTSFLSLLKCELNVSDTLYFQMYALLNDTRSAKISIFSHTN